MNLIDARALRDVIREKTGCHCIVPLGYGPDGYFARIYNTDGPVDFQSVDQAKGYFKRRDAAKRLSKPRSPIEIAIDKACGYEPGKSQ